MSSKHYFHPVPCMLHAEVLLNRSELYKSAKAATTDALTYRLSRNVRVMTPYYAYILITMSIPCLMQDKGHRRSENISSEP